jgi:hypothetical protein
MRYNIVAIEITPENPTTNRYPKIMVIPNPERTVILCFEKNPPKRSRTASKLLVAAM